MCAVCSVSCAHVLHMIPWYREKAGALETELVETQGAGTGCMAAVTDFAAN